LPDGDTQKNKKKMCTEKQKTGRLYGVGVGPGDVQLLTLRAYHVLSLVPVIFVPQKDAYRRSYALSIIDSLVETGDKTVVGLVFPMLKDETALNEHWQQAANVMWQYLKDGNDCAFVNVGDPLLYGTLIHVLNTLQNSHPEVEIEVIPGVSSINAAAARAMLPLATKDERVAILSGNCHSGFVRETLANFDTVVFLKMHNTFDQLFGILKEMNLVEKSIYISRCTAPDEEVVRDINRLKGAKLDYLSLLIVRR
jgi:precorrin-2/cobalt-factor-2 C20-methyltransferase